VNGACLAVAASLAKQELDLQPASILGTSPPGSRAAGSTLGGFYLQVPLLPWQRLLSSWVSPPAHKTIMASRHHSNNGNY